MRGRGRGLRSHTSLEGSLCVGRQGATQVRSAGHMGSVFPGNFPRCCGRDTVLFPCSETQRMTRIAPVRCVVLRRIRKRV